MSYTEMPTQKYRVTATFEIEVNAETWEGQPFPDEIIEQAIEAHLISSAFDDYVSSNAYEHSGYVEDDDGDEVDHCEDLRIVSAYPSVRLSPIITSVTQLTATDSPPPPDDDPQPSNFWASLPGRPA